MNRIELKPCPFCGAQIRVVVMDRVLDDETNNFRLKAGYEEYPWLGLGYGLYHEIADDPNERCPIAGYVDEGELGIFIYDTREEAAQAWNRRAG